MGKIIWFCGDTRQTNVSCQRKNNYCAKTSESATPPLTASSGIQSTGSLSTWQRSSEKETLSIERNL